MAAAQDAPLSTESEVPANSDVPSQAQPPATRSTKTDSASDKGSTTVNGTDSQSVTSSTPAVPATDTPKDNSTVQSSTSTPAPYGTRSRNRGVPRPNYAEDRDLDLELEPPTVSKAASAKKPSTSSFSTSRASPVAASDRNVGVSTRRTQNSTNNYGSGTKEPIPGTSTFSANPNSTYNGSKKRKQPGSSTTVQGTSTPTTTTQVSKKITVPASRSPEIEAATNMMTFNNSRGCLKNGKLKADDGTVLAPNDHVYLICEPPGEPYYLARIMEFVASKDTPSGPIEAVRVNWYYRPRDIQRRSADPRMLFASMHSDTCPLTALRGKCKILHLSEIPNLEEYRKGQDCFWFEKMYDRYIQRYYEVIPTNQVINVPQRVKQVLDERWKFILVEVGRSKELTGAVKTCTRCNQYAANVDSVDCAVCFRTYHMKCVRPALQKKPARGFAWACAPCSRAQEMKMEARNTPIVGDASRELEPELLEEEDEDIANAAEATQQSSPSTEEVVHHTATPEQTAQAKLWPFRYLGIHCPPEEALEYDDRIYPRASSRIGPRHQANVPPWYGRPVRYVKVLEAKKKAIKQKKDSKLSKEALAAIEAEKAEKANRPKWVQDEPPGFIRRGEDEPINIDGKDIVTAELIFKMPDEKQPMLREKHGIPKPLPTIEEREQFVDEYIDAAHKIGSSRGLKNSDLAVLDYGLKNLTAEKFNFEAAEKKTHFFEFSELGEPDLSVEEKKRFKQGVKKYGSELRLVTKYVGTVPHGQIVRYYYKWKKTPEGREIWGNFEGRRGKKALKKSDNSTAKLVDDIADDHDDSAFDQGKASGKKQGFSCKFCSTRTSRRWRRAPFVPPGTTVEAESTSRKDKGITYNVALCQRCGLLWRKYALQWENPDEVAKRIVQGGTKSWRRKFEEELLFQLLMFTETDIKINNTTASTAATLGIPALPDVGKESVVEPPRKKARTTEKDSATPAKESSVEQAPRRRAAEKPNEPPPLAPEPPKPKTLPCAICFKMEPVGDQHLSCRDCRLTVHRQCYGVNASRNAAKWFCDTCSNDHNPAISTRYECVLCPVTWTEHELMEPPKISHKKKTEREREKERLEKDMVAEAIKLYRQRQESAGKPVGPREALKRTAGNNWVHVTCAIWHPEIKFANAKEYEPAEGMGLIPPERFLDICKICKTNNGACVSCHVPACNAKFHVGCAHHAGYRFGFDITPVKVSRRDTVNTLKLGDESGAVTAAIWCPHHAVSTVVHDIDEPSGTDNLNALQLYSRTCKQADLTLTGTVRKAAHFQQTASINGGYGSARRAAAANGAGPGHARKESLQATTNARGLSAEQSPKVDQQNANEPNGNENSNGVPEGKKCYRCKGTVSPIWWLRPSVQTEPAPRKKSNGVPYDGACEVWSINPKKNTEKPTYECHKCHFKKSESPAVPSRRQSPFVAKRDASVPANRGPEYPHSFAPSPRVQAVQPRPSPQAPPLVPHHPPPGPEWRPEYDQRPADYGPPMVRNGMPPGPPGPSGPPGPPGPPNGMPLPPPNYHPGPPPPPPPAPHLNGYGASLAPPQHYPGAVPPPPPHAFAPHPNAYPPVPVASTSGPPPGPPNVGHPYTSASPPTMHYATPVPMGGIPPGPPPPVRMFSVERPLAPTLQSPSMHRRSIDSQRAGTPSAPELQQSQHSQQQQHQQQAPTSQQNPVGPEPNTANGPRPPSSGHTNTGIQQPPPPPPPPPPQPQSQAPLPPPPAPATGASASPSLKNLLT